MKALSVKQPYATALAEGAKHIEFRSKPTNHRGYLLICASKSEKGVWIDTSPPLPLPVGVMLTVRELIDCRPMAEADKSEFGAPQNIDGWYAWVFSPDYGDTLIPKAVKGAISFFTVDDDEIESIEEGRPWTDYDYPNKSEKIPKDLVFNRDF